MDPFWGYARRIQPGRSVLNPLYDVPDSQLDRISGRPPRWLVITATLAANDQQEFRVLCKQPIWVRYILGSSSQAAGFQVTFFEDIVDPDTGQPSGGQAWGDRLAFGSVVTGSAQKPVVLKRPHLLEAFRRVRCRITNLANAQATIYVVLQGVRDKQHAGPVRFPR